MKKIFYFGLLFLVVFSCACKRKDGDPISRRGHWEVVKEEVFEKEIPQEDEEIDEEMNDKVCL
jgi:hypothetical protein